MRMQTCNKALCKVVRQNADMFAACCYRSNDRSYLSALVVLNTVAQHFGSTPRSLEQVRYRITVSHRLTCCTVSRAASCLSAVCAVPSGAASFSDLTTSFSGATTAPSLAAAAAASWFTAAAGCCCCCCEFSAAAVVAAELLRLCSSSSGAASTSGDEAVKASSDVSLAALLARSLLC
jgi:hypothetical protein